MPSYLIGLIFFVIFIVVVRVLMIKLSHAIHSALNSSSARMTADLLAAGMNAEQPPYPVPNLTAAFKPKIERDFPEISYEHMEAMARNGIISILNAVESKRSDNVENASNTLKNQLKIIIEDYSRRQEDIHYDNVDIHGVGIENYISNQSSASVIFQVSLQSLAYRTKNGAVVSGSNTKPTQNLFSVILTHDQKGSSDNKNYIEANCPNCGAPIEDIQSRKCSYCGSGLVPVVDKIWQIDSFKLLK